MLLNNRIIYDDNGTLRDYSIKVGNYVGGSENFVVVAAQDKLYIGSDMPFNHRYFDIGTGNTNAGNISKIEYWSSNEWIEAVDILDETHNGTATMAQSGIVTFIPDKEYIWSSDDTIENGQELITGLGNVTIYGLYWARMTFSADFSIGTTIKYIGHKFATDDDVATQYPDLIRSDVLDHFETGKTDWNEQLIASSEIIVRDLKKKGIIKSGNQILNSGIFKDACVHKLAEVVYNGFGKDYVENRREAKIQYDAALNLSMFQVDQNCDAILSPAEMVISSGVLKR
jgi:hypothetical protein